VKHNDKKNFRKCYNNKISSADTINVTDRRGVVKCRNR